MLGLGMGRGAGGEQIWGLRDHRCLGMPRGKYPESRNERISPDPDLGDATEHNLSVVLIVRDSEQFRFVDESKAQFSCRLWMCPSCGVSMLHDSLLAG